MITAAGILFLAPGKNVLFLKRGPDGDYAGYWCFPGGKQEDGESLIQCAEQLEGPEEVLRTTYSNSTWQNHTFDAAKAVARGDQGRLADWGLSLGLFGYPEQESTNSDMIPKTALQYIENHDHERFICNFGLINPDEADNPLFLQGDRSRWYMLQPYLIAILMSKGVPMLWQGEEFGEQRLVDALRANRELAPRELMEAVVGQVERFGGCEQFDDITLVVARCLDSEKISGKNYSLWDV